MKIIFLVSISFYALIVVATGCNYSHKQPATNTIALPDGDLLRCTYDRSSQLGKVEQLSASQKLKWTLKRQLMGETEIISIIAPDGKQLSETTIEPNSIESGIRSKQTNHSWEWDAQKNVHTWTFDGEAILIISNYFPRGGEKGQKIFGPLGVDLTRQ
jgi:hypothetical protein